MSTEFLGSIVEDGEFGTHEEAAVVEYHFIGTANLGPFIAVGTIIERGKVMPTTVSCRAEIRCDA